MFRCKRKLTLSTSSRKPLRGRSTSAASKRQRDLNQELRLGRATEQLQTPVRLVRTPIVLFSLSGKPVSADAYLIVTSGRRHSGPIAGRVNEERSGRCTIGVG